MCTKTTESSRSLYSGVHQEKKSDSLLASKSCSLIESAEKIIQNVELHLNIGGA